MARGNLTDERLFDRLVRGDREALGPLMERHGDALKLYINGYVQDLDMAEEIMLEAFARMLVKAPRMHEGGFKPYLFKAGRNLALKHLKYRSRITSLDAMAYEPVDERQLDEGLLTSEQNRELYRNLDRISPDYREALFLVYIEDMSYDEAAAVMRKSYKQVENLVYRGKRAMKDLMNAQEGAAPAVGTRTSTPAPPVMAAGLGVSPTVLGGGGA